VPSVFPAARKGIHDADRLLTAGADEWGEGQLDHFDLGGARRAAAQWPQRAVGDAEQVFRAKGRRASVALELLAARAEQRATITTGFQLECDTCTIFITVDRNTCKGSVTGGAGCSREVGCHNDIMNYRLIESQQ